MVQLAFIFGILGNIVSFLVFLAPLKTFFKIYKKKSTEGFQSVPYVVALFSAMLWMYYAFLKTNTTLLITINSVGCIIQTIYISFYLFYAPRQARIQTVKFLSLVVVGYGLIILLSQLLAKGQACAIIVGWICLVFALCVFIAPLAIVRQVIRTKSVEYMPFLLSFTLTLSAVMWFFYGLLLKDYNIAIPNVLGFFFGALQMVLYLIYKKPGSKIVEPKHPQTTTSQNIIVLEESKLPLPGELQEQILDVIKLSAIVSGASEIPPVLPHQVVVLSSATNENGHLDIKDADDNKMKTLQALQTIKEALN